jgi:beta-N-acetylhexosaminidase
MTEDRLPPDEPDFEWTEPPEQPARRRREPGESETGEREGLGTAERTVERRPARGDTGEYERAGRRPPPGRRTRRRDLPARVRRRQDFAVGAVAVAVVVGGILLITAGGGGEEQQETPLKKLIGQTLVGRMGKGGPDQEMLRQVRKGQVGSLIVLPRDANSLREDVATVQTAAREGGNPPLLIMIDQEGGSVERLPGPPNAAPNELGETGDADAARLEGQATANLLSPLGVDVNLAPLLDVTLPRTADTIASRTFGDDAAQVSEIGVAFIEGMQSGGVAATAKHFPGLGLSTVNTDDREVTIVATPAELETALLPFRDAVEAGVELVMVSTATYPSFDGQDPAALSPAVVQGQLRQNLGFEGAIISDDLEAGSITDVTTPEKAAVGALQAGNDLLLFARREGTAVSALKEVARAIKGGQLDRAVVEAAYVDVLTLKVALPAG